MLGQGRILFFPILEMRKIGSDVLVIYHHTTNDQKLNGLNNFIFSVNQGWLSGGLCFKVSHKAAIQCVGQG